MKYDFNELIAGFDSLFVFHFRLRKANTFSKSEIGLTHFKLKLE